MELEERVDSTGPLTFQSRCFSFQSFYGCRFFPLCRVFFSPCFELCLKGSQYRPMLILYHSQEHRNAKQISARFDKHPCVSVKACVFFCFFFKLDFFVVHGSSTLWQQLMLLLSPWLKTKSNLSLTTLFFIYLFPKCKKN